tara:strand:- start:4778 stop:5617 length:840 start_codon:yes stop_codon:yes gene_type:complete
MQKTKIINYLEKYFNSKISLINIVTLSESFFNSTFKLNTNKGSFFIKYNSKPKTDFFKKEFDGLKKIEASNTFLVPKIICFTDNFIIMDFVNRSIAKKKHWEKLGANLAKLHYNSNDYFGLEYDNYIGDLNQSNTKCLSWSEFFINERLIPQIKKNDFSKNDFKMFDKLFYVVEKNFPKENPSLLHGDLWNGNFMFSKDDCFVIDPAIYYGFREVDIAMSKLFGGFDQVFYDAYIYSFPLENDWKDRIDLCNLYPLLVHLNIFGNSYYNSIISIIKRYI